MNWRKNVIAVDACTPSAVSTLLFTLLSCGMAARSYLPRRRYTVMGVIQDVDNSVPDSYLASLVSSGTSVIEFRRFITSQSMKIVFQGDSPPAMVKVGLAHHPDRPYVPRPLHCRTCMKLGHVTDACTFQGKCGHCGSSFKTVGCTSQQQQCVNCLGDHDATINDCPHPQKEMKISKRMA